MLSDSTIHGSHGVFDEELHLRWTARYELFDFITSELPRWRDHRDRPPETSETALTSTLCAHLNGAARFSDAWSRIQFLPEESDEIRKGRKIDFAPKPIGAVIIIEGRRHTQFDKLFPIECKRLPTPKGSGRDEREYVTTRRGSTGGIQRFKEGHHGAAHAFGGMIGYIQNGSEEQWLAEINSWITDLAKQHGSFWSEREDLALIADDKDRGVSCYRSNHTRTSTDAGIELRHSWVIMNV